MQGNYNAVWYAKDLAEGKRLLAHFEEK